MLNKVLHHICESWSLSKVLCQFCGPGSCLNIKTVFPRYGESHVKDKTVARLSYLKHRDPYTGKTTSLYWDGPQGSRARFSINSVDQGSWARFSINSVDQDSSARFSINSVDQGSSASFSIKSLWLRVAEQVSINLIMNWLIQISMIFLGKPAYFVFKVCILIVLNTLAAVWEMLCWWQDITLRGNQHWWRRQKSWSRLHWWFEPASSVLMFKGLYLIISKTLALNFSLELKKCSEFLICKISKTKYACFFWQNHPSLYGPVLWLFCLIKLARAVHQCTRSGCCKAV